MIEFNNILNNSINILYRFDKQQKFEFNKEISIVDTVDVVIFTAQQLKQLCRTKKKD